MVEAEPSASEKSFEEGGSSSNFEPVVVLRTGFTGVGVVRLVENSMSSEEYQKAFKDRLRLHVLAKT